MSSKIGQILAFITGGQKTKRRMVKSFLWGLPIMALGFVIGGVSALYGYGKVKSNGLIVQGSEKEFISYVFIMLGVFFGICWILLFRFRERIEK